MKRKYWTHPEEYKVEVDVIPIGGGDFILEPIVFHPEEGGQPSDKGKVGGANITAVAVKDGKVCVTLDKGIEAGKHIAEVDKEHRMDISRQHTAQHIISAYAEREFKCPTFGFHIGEEQSTLDLKSPITWEQAELLEKLANETVMEDVPVDTNFGANGKDLRIREDLLQGPPEDLRVVNISDLDMSACCGTHVTSTGKIGPIRMTGLESHKGGSRITYVAGTRAIMYALGEEKIVRELKGLATSATSELPAAFAKMLSHVTESNREINRLWETMLPLEAEKTEIFEADGIKYGILQTLAPGKLLAKLTAIVTEKVGGVALVFESKDNPQIVVGSKIKPANAILMILQEKLGGKGGGSPTSASGMLPGNITQQKIKEALGL